MEKKIFYGAITVIVLLSVVCVYFWQAFNQSEKIQRDLKSQVEYIENKRKDDSLLNNIKLQTIKSNEKIIKWKKEIIRDTVYMFVDDATKIKLFTEFTNKK